MRFSRARLTRSAMALMTPLFPSELRHVLAEDRNNPYYPTILQEHEMAPCGVYRQPSSFGEASADPVGEEKSEPASSNPLAKIRNTSGYLRAAWQRYLRRTAHMQDTLTIHRPHPVPKLGHVPVTVSPAPTRAHVRWRSAAFSRQVGYVVPMAQGGVTFAFDGTQTLSCTVPCITS
jgi:hypothetical protein